MHAPAFLKHFSWDKPNKPKTNPSIDQAINTEYLPILKLQSQHQLVDVTFDWDDDIYQSIFISLDQEHGLLTIDELFQAPKVQVNLTNQVIHIHSRDPASTLHFKSTVVEHSLDNATSTLVIQLPSHIASEQRRHDFRISVFNITHSLASLDINDNSHIDGTIVNVSHKGTRIMLSGPLPEIFQNLLVIPSCHLEVGDNLELDCRLEVCSKVSGKSPQEHSFIGGRFAGLSHKQESALSQFIMLKDREQRKSNFDNE